jgi:hypothetical protein
MILLLTALSAHATILWAGGEDIDFPNNFSGGPAVMTAGSGQYDPTYTRAAVFPSTGYVVSNSFAGGPVTTAWLHEVVYNNVNVCCNVNAVSPVLGLTGGPSTNAGLWIGTYNYGSQLSLYKFNGSTFTTLASEPGNSFICCARYSLDLHVVSFGTSATVTVYVNGSPTPIISYSGDVTVSGVSSVSAVSLARVNYISYFPTSQIIVSDTDTRTMHLATLAPNAAGDANAWTGSYTNINPISINDASVIYDANAGDNFESKLNALPAGTFWVPAVVVKARGVKGSTGLGSLGLGVKTNSVINIPGFSSQQLYWSTTETYYQSNPVTSASWTQGDVNALQINLQSSN